MLISTEMWFIAHPHRTSEDVRLDVQVHVHDTLVRINKAKWVLYQRCKRCPRDEEVAEMLSISVSKVRMVSRAARTPQSLHKLVGKHHDQKLGVSKFESMPPLLWLFSFTSLVSGRGNVPLGNGMPGSSFATLFAFFLLRCKVSLTLFMCLLSTWMKSYVCHSCAGIVLQELLAAPGVNSAEDCVSLEFEKQYVHNLLSTLNERERAVLKLRFGLEDGNARTLEEIGRIFDVTRERIRQIEVTAIRKLKQQTSQCQYVKFWSP